MRRSPSITASIRWPGSVVCVGRLFLRVSPIVVVTDVRENRYHIPPWMMLPEASQCGLRNVPHLSLAALADLRELVSSFLCQP